jgi:RimJ/RimL family protein N-acetyltransferase
MATMDSTVTAPPTATEPGLLLRSWTERDIPAMVAAHRDPLMRRWMRHPIMTAEQARQSVEARRADRQADRAFSFAMLEIDADGTAGEPVGSVLIRSLTSKAASGEVGYWVAAHARGLRPNFPTTGTCTALDHGRDR